MEYFTIRNTAILALTQIGVIVVGVLAAGATHKWYTTFDMKPPTSTALLAEYGFLGLVLPVAWVAVALWALSRGDDADAARVCAFFSGIVLLLLLLLGVGYFAIRPWCRLLGSFCGGFG